MGKSDSEHVTIPVDVPENVLIDDLKPIDPLEYRQVIKRQAERIMNRMKVTNLETAITNFDDVVFKDNDKPLTLRRVMMNALATGVPSDQSAQVKDKEHCYDLMMIVKSANGELELEAEDLTIIKSRINQLYQPIIVGQSVKLIEGKTGSGWPRIK